MFVLHKPGQGSLVKIFDIIINVAYVNKNSIMTQCGHCESEPQISKD